MFCEERGRLDVALVDSVWVCVASNVISFSGTVRGCSGLLRKMGENVFFGQMLRILTGII